MNRNAYASDEIIKDQCVKPSLQIPGFGGYQSIDDDDEDDGRATTLN